jgi:hypothetical protein
MKKRRRRERAKEILASRPGIETLYIRDLRKKPRRRLEQHEEEYKDPRTVRYLFKEKHPLHVEMSRKYNYRQYPTIVDDVSARIIMNTRMVQMTDWREVCTSRFVTPNLGVMLDNVMRYDVPDVVMDTEGVKYLTKTECRMIAREIGRPVVRFDANAVPCFSSEVMGSFPGLSYRQMGRRTKSDVEILAPIEAVAARKDLMRGKTFRHRPCALFGRGKLVGGIEPGCQVGSGGRLVMAPDGRDHLVMQPEAKNLLETIRTNWQTSNISVGLSYPNGGAMMWIANIICDLKGNSRIGPEHNPSYEEVLQARVEVDTFFDTEEREYYYINLDVSKQDTTISTYSIDAYFRAVFRSFVAYGKNQTKLGRLLRWSEEFHKHTRFVLPDGQVWRKHRGNVSGSPHTTLLNSWTQAMLVESAIAYIFNGDIPPGITWRIYGDNTLIAVHKRYRERVTLEILSEILVEMFSSKINVEESRLNSYLLYAEGRPYEEVAEFLGKRVMRDGLVWRPTFQSLCALIHPDAGTLTNDLRYSRVNGLLIDNPGNGEWQTFGRILMDELEEQGAKFGELAPREVMKFVYGRGMPAEYIEKPFRMNRRDLRLLYTSARDSPLRERFEDEHASERTAILIADLMRKSRARAEEMRNET